MAEPLMLWSETLRFLELLGRTPETVDALVFPPKTGPGSDKGAKKITLDEEGRQSVEQLLSMPLYKFHSLGVRPNPGGSKEAEITEGRALFFETDGGLSIEAQEALPDLLGLPEPSVTVWTGGKSLHQYWVAPEGESLSPEAWKKAQARLIAAVKEVAPDAGVDECIKDPSRVMRAPGGLHPSGGRASIRSESGHRYDLAALVEMLPALPEIKKAPTVARAEGSKEEEVVKARKALDFLPPLEFTSYGEWLGVGMALHSVSSDLLTDWIEWSQGMGEAFDEEEHSEKWKTFDEERDEGITLGSLIHWAKEYGYQPQGAEAPPSRYTAESASSASSASATVRGVRGLSIHERMDLLREAAELLLTEEAALLDRLPAMRERASELDLPVRDGDLTKIIWEARRRLSAPVAALGEGDLLDFTPVPWCWEGLIMREATNLVIAAPKVGKTSLILEAIGAWNRGEAFLGRAFHGACPPVLIVGTDQPQSDWGRMLQKVGLVSQERRILAPLVGLFHSGTPLQLDPEGIEKIASYAKNHPGLLVLVDSYSRCISSLGLSERDAEVVGPLADLQEAVAHYGATLVVIHHSNKGAHDSGSMASRGSTALPAAVSQILHLQRLEASQEQQGASAGKRMLTTEGRGGAPEKFLIELDQEGRWIFKGDGEALLREQERQRTLASLTERQSIALEHLEEVWFQTEGKQGISADLLASLMELSGASPSRAARHLLEQLREKGLARKVIQSDGKSQGTLARYAPTHQEAHDPQTPQTQFPLAEADEADEASAAQEREEGASVDSAPFPVGLFESVEVFQGGQWRNGWVVSEEGQELGLFRSDDPEQTLRLDWSLVRPCRS